MQSDWLTDPSQPEKLTFSQLLNTRDGTDGPTMHFGIGISLTHWLIDFAWGDPEMHCGSIRLFNILTEAEAWFILLRLRHP